MNAIAQILLAGWIPIAIAHYLLFRPPVAAFVSILTGTLFLPVAAFSLPGFPDYTKFVASCLGPFIGCALLSSSSLTRYRPGLIDLVVLAWCAVPLASSVTAGYGPVEGFAGVIRTLILWYCPFMLGRVFARDARGAIDLLSCIVLLGVIYTPLVLYEIRMSPQLHSILYGYFPHDFSQTRRGEGWRPSVFMQHGLAAAMMIAIAALAACGLWLLRVRCKMFGLPVWLIAVGLAGLAIAMRSVGAAALMMAGIGVLVAARTTKSSFWVLPAVLLPPIYLFARVGLRLHPDWLVNAAELFFGPNRAASLASRIDSETVLIEQVLSRWAFGQSRFIWAGQEVDGRKLIPDSFWIVTLAKNGMVGLTLVYVLLVVPAFLAARRWRRVKIGAPTSPTASVACILAALAGVYALDSLFNAMFNPIMPVVLGALVSLASIKASAGEHHHLGRASYGSRPTT